WSKIYGVGLAVVEGLVDGIFGVDLHFKLGEWVTQHLVDPFKSLLGISSPSTVFAEFGRNLIEGLVQGIDSMGGAIKGAVRGIAQIVLDGLNALINAWDLVRFPPIEIDAGPIQVHYPGGGFPHIDILALPKFAQGGAFDV